jgi:hypothetical protein
MTAVLGAFAVLFDMLFVMTLLNYSSHDNRISCPPAGCRTILTPLILVGLFAFVSSLGFLAALVTRKRKDAPP